MLLEIMHGAWSWWTNGFDKAHRVIEKPFRIVGGEEIRADDVDGVAGGTGRP